MKYLSVEEAKEGNRNREVLIGVLDDIELWVVEDSRVRLTIGKESWYLADTELRAIESLIGYYFKDRRHLENVFQMVQDGVMDEINKME